MTREKIKEALGNFWENLKSSNIKGYPKIKNFGKVEIEGKEYTEYGIVAAIEKTVFAVCEAKDKSSYIFTFISGDGTYHSHTISVLDKTTIAEIHEELRKELGYYFTPPEEFVAMPITNSSVDAFRTGPADDDSSDPKEE
jgi:hypothetical protein